MEETPKKCKDIIKTARSLLNDVQFAQFGDDPKVQLVHFQLNMDISELTADMSYSYHNMLSFILLFLFLQEEVMVLERILLQTIKFDLQVEHPYMFLLRYVKQLKGWKKFSFTHAPY